MELFPTEFSHPHATPPPDSDVPSAGVAVVDPALEHNHSHNHGHGHGHEHSQFHDHKESHEHSHAHEHSHEQQQQQQPAGPPASLNDGLGEHKYTHTQVHAHDPAQVHAHDHAHAHAHAHSHGNSVDMPGTGTPSDPTAYRPKALLQHMTEEEKKERQKQQNRRAAERSRNKKREEITALEMTVNNIQDENQRLRARLAALLTAKPGDTTPQPPAPADVDASVPTGIDYATLSKLQAELSSAKATLQQRELELSKAQGLQTAEGTDDIRATLLASTANLQSLQAEVKALHSLISHLRRERDNLARQRETLGRELEARRTLKEAVADTPAGNQRAAGVERALLDLRGLVDGVIKSWDQTSVLPPRRLEGSETDTAPE